MGQGVEEGRKELNCIARMGNEDDEVVSTLLYKSPNVTKTKTQIRQFERPCDILHASKKRRPHTTFNRSTVEIYHAIQVPSGHCEFFRLSRIVQSLGRNCYRIDG